MGDQEIEWFAKRILSKAPIWRTKPCVSISKSGIAFNAIAESTFSLRQGDAVLVGVSLGRLLFKIPDTSTEIDQAYALVRSKAKGPGQTLRINNKAITNFLAKRGVPMGEFELRLNAQLRVMEALIPQPNGEAVEKGEA